MWAWVKDNTKEGVMHSEILGVFLDFGVIGCSLLFLSFYTILKQARGVWRSENNPWARAVGPATMLGIAASIPRFLSLGSSS